MLNDLVKKSRSYRAFKPDGEIPREALVSMINTARICNATKNIQPLKYRIVHTKEECAKVLSATSWAGALKIKLPPEGKAPAAYIVVCHDTEVVPFSPAYLKDVGIVSQTIMLCASEAGYGGCMIGSADEEKLRAALSLTANFLPQLVLALGVPNETVILTAAENGNITYYRDENGIHYTPKRKLEDIII